MRPSDLRATLEELHHVSEHTHAEIARLVGRLSQSPPPSVKTLHDLKADLTYLRLALRKVADHAAACGRQLPPDPLAPRRHPLP